MSRYKNGNPKRASQFLCLHCMKINPVGSGIQRGCRQREKFHIKDLLCINCDCQTITKNMEIRWCDQYEEIYEEALKIREQYYSK